MPESSRIKLNDAPKWFKIILVLFPLIGIAIINTGFHNDLYFLFPTGEYILNNGFPHTDFLSMHSDMKIVVQQWLSSIIFYYVYSALENTGITAMIYICYVALVFLVFKLLVTITDNFSVSVAFSFVICILMAAMYEVARPQIFTYLIIISELLCLEKFVKTKKNYHLFFIPVLSVLLVNLHSAMWAMLFVFAAPYAVAALPIKIGKIKQTPCCSFVKLLVCGIVTFAAGFLNPYGWEAMAYVLTSFGLGDINLRVYEMSQTTLSSGSGAFFFAVLAILVIVAIIKKERFFTTRFVLLFAGTLLLALLNIKSIAYFLIVSVPAYSYLVKSAEVTLPKPKDNKSAVPNKKRIALLCALIVAFGALAVVLAVRPIQPAQENVKSEKSVYEYMDEMTEILDQSDEEVVLFAGFDWGQYLEFKGYHPYIDGRAELFMKQNNGYFDYLNEYNQIINGSLYYNDFVDKYHFNYLIVSEREICFLSSLKHDPDFEILVDSDEITLFRYTNG